MERENYSEEICENLKRLGAIDFLKQANYRIFMSSSEDKKNIYKFSDKEMYYQVHHYFNNKEEMVEETIKTNIARQEMTKYYTFAENTICLNNWRKECGGKYITDFEDEIKKTMLIMAGKYGLVLIDGKYGSGWKDIIPEVMKLLDKKI